MLTIKPILYNNINSFSDLERFVVIQGNAVTCYVQLRTAESNQRYVPLAGSVLQVKFPRTLSVAAVPLNQDVTVTLSVVDSRDASLFKFDISAAQSDILISGGIKLLVTEAAILKTFPVDNFVLRRSNAPGA